MQQVKTAVIKQILYLLPVYIQRALQTGFIYKFFIEN